MKRLQLKILLLLIFTILSVSHGNCQKVTDIIGKWKGYDYWHNKSELIFTVDGYATLTVNEEKIGGENFIMNGKEASLKYEIDSSKNPIWIDLIIYSEKVEKGRFMGILHYIDENNAEILLSFDGTRFEEFSKENGENIIRMER